MSENQASQSGSIYSVHRSDKSQTTIIFRRTPIVPPKEATKPALKENPYIFKPKSYSSKRTAKQQSYQQVTSPPPQKKIKLNPPNITQNHQDNLLDLDFIKNQLQIEPYQFLTSSTQTQKKKEQFDMQEEFPFTLPLRMGSDYKPKANPQLSHKIQIVSTDNYKIQVPIHQGLLRANTNHAKQEKSLEGISNPFNKQLMAHYSSQISFVKDYKSGYTPIELQNRSQREEDKRQGEEESKKNTKNSKAHFIRKKQSTLSLTRSCGVSYIKPTQSVQGPPFEPLPPIIFQCSTSCQYTPQLHRKYSDSIDIFISLVNTRWLPFIVCRQQEMRDLLLGRPCGRVAWVKGLINLWPLFNQGSFMLVILDEKFAQTQEEVWNQLNTCHFKLGILAKKSTSGKKMFLKSIQADLIDKQQTLSLNSLQSLPNNLLKQESLKSQNQEFSQKISQKNFEQQKIEVQPIQNAAEQNSNRSLTKIQQKNVQLNPSHQEAMNHQNALQLLDSQKLSEKKESSPVQPQIVNKKYEENSSQDRKQCKDVCQEFMRQLKNSRTVITMSLKFEMYVPESFWKGLNLSSKNLLNAIVLTFEQNLQGKALEVIRDRLELASGSVKEQLLSQVMDKLRLGGTISHMKSAENFVAQNAYYNLERLNKLNEKLQKREPLIPGQPMKVQLLQQDRQGRYNKALWQKTLKMPIYYISTRDSFAFDLIQTITYHPRGGRFYKKIVYTFEPDNMPDNFRDYKHLFPQLQVGLTAYHDFYTDQQLKGFQENMMKTQRSAFKNKFLQMTVQPTIVANRIKRTKFFFGYRYMWTRCQLAEPMSFVGAGVRRDVTRQPKWLQQVEKPLVQHGIVAPQFLNSYAMNVYHDGSEGLAQHFDDAVRFKQPIYTLRLVSEGRLSFGSQFYGFCNGAFIVPLPRGCILVMEENSYAANGVKHCVRPCDMSGKSAAVIMRQMHSQVVKEASKYDQLIDFPAWLSTLSEHPQAITFAEQKRRESENILTDIDQKKEKDKPKIVASY